MRGKNCSFQLKFFLFIIGLHFFVNQNPLGSTRVEKNIYNLYKEIFFTNSVEYTYGDPSLGKTSKTVVISSHTHTHTHTRSHAHGHTHTLPGIRARIHAFLISPSQLNKTYCRYPTAHRHRWDQYIPLCWHQLKIRSKRIIITNKYLKIVYHSIPSQQWDSKRIFYTFW